MNRFFPLQNFDGLSPQTTKGDLIGRTTVGATRVAVGSDNTVLTADSSNALGVSWKSASANLAVNTLAGATTLPAVSQVVIASGSTYAITLPTAVSNNGLYYYIKTTVGLGTPISITTTGGQTIDGSAGVTMQTQYEAFELVSDGSNWQVIGHAYTNKWITYTAGTTGLGTISGASSMFFWSRDGENMRVKGLITTGTVAAIGIQIALPTPAVISSTLLNSNSDICGIFESNNTSLSQNSLILLAQGGATIFQVGAKETATANKMNAASGTSIMANGNFCVFQAEVPIAGWYS